MISVAAVCALTYLAFVFFSEQMNPFRKPRLQMSRPQWRYGRRMALAVLIGGLCMLFLAKVALMAWVSALGFGGAVAVLLGLGFSYGKISGMLSGGDDHLHGGHH